MIERLGGPAADGQSQAELVVEVVVVGIEPNEQPVPLDRRLETPGLEKDGGLLAESGYLIPEPGIGGVQASGLAEGRDRLGVFAPGPKRSGTGHVPLGLDEAGGLLPGGSEVLGIDPREPGKIGLPVPLDRLHSGRPLPPAAEAAGGGELEKRIVVGVERGTGHEAGRRVGSHHVEGQQLGYRFDVYPLEIRGHGLLGDPAGERRLVDHQLALGPDEKVVAARGLPDREFFEDRLERAHDAAKEIQVDGGRLEPDARDPPVGEPLAAQLEELPGEEVGDAGDPEVGRLRDDHVVLRRRKRHVIPAVGDDQAHPRIIQDVVVVGAEEASGLHDASRELHAIQSLERVCSRRAERHAAGQTDDQGPAGVRMEQQGNVSQKLLLVKTPYRRRLRDAVDEEHENAVGVFLDGDGGAEPFSVKEHVVPPRDPLQGLAGLSQLRRQLPGGREWPEAHARSVPGGHRADDESGHHEHGACHQPPAEGTYAAADPQQCAAAEDVRRDRGQDRLLKAQPRNQDEASDKGAGNGAERVGGVDHPHRSAHGLGPPDHEAAGQGKGRAHERGGHEHDQEDQPELGPLELPE